MSFLTILGAFFVISGITLIGLSIKYFLMGMQELQIGKNYKKSIFKKY